MKDATYPVTVKYLYEIVIVGEIAIVGMFVTVALMIALMIYLGIKDERDL